MAFVTLIIILKRDEGGVASVSVPVKKVERRGLCACVRKRGEGGASVPVGPSGEGVASLHVCKLLCNHVMRS